MTDGAIWLDERRLDEVGPEDRGFGMVFQNYALFPHMTVRRNIGVRPGDAAAAEGGDRAAGGSRRWRWCGWRRRRDKLPGQLSGGQQQRVAIARAIVVEPPLVLMDEPLSNLDAKLRLEMRAEIRRIHTMLGCSTIYVTHDQEEALSLADRILVMIDGQTRQIGTPEELYARPAHARCRGVHGLSQSGHVTGRGRPMAASRSTIGGARLSSARRWRRSAARAVVAIRPDDLQPTRRRTDRGDGGDRRIPRPRLLRAWRAAPTARSCISAPIGA